MKKLRLQLYIKLIFIKKRFDHRQFNDFVEIHVNILNHHYRNTHKKPVF